MSILRVRLKTVSPELWQALENSWSIALTHWLPKVDMGSTTNSSNSYPHLHNLESHLDRVILGYEDYHAQRGKKNIIELSPVELYVICASILFHDIGRIYQNKDEKTVRKNGALFLNEFVNSLINSSYFNDITIIDKPSLNKYIAEIQKIFDENIQIEEKVHKELIEYIINSINTLKQVINKSGYRPETVDFIKSIAKVNLNPNQVITYNDSKQVIDLLKYENIFQNEEEVKAFSEFRKALNGFILNPEQLRKIEEKVKQCSKYTTSSENETIFNAFLKTRFQGLFNYTDNVFIAVSPQHGYYARRILIDENHYAELGIPSEYMAKAIASICEYHTNLDLPLQTISIHPYGKIRCRELGSLLTLIDEMDDSHDRVYSEYIKDVENNQKDFKATFRQKTGDVYIDPDKHTIFSVIDNIEDEGLRKQYYKILQDKNKRLEQLKSGLVRLGIYLQGWKLECDENIYIVNKKYEYKSSYEACFYKEYLENVIDCMWDLSTQIFGASSISYEQLAAKMCEKDIEKVKMVVYRLSILARSSEDKSSKDNVGIWAGKDQWKWLVTKEKNNLCDFITTEKLKDIIKEGECK